MAESVGKRRSARTRLPSLKAELNESSRALVVATPPSTREKGYQEEKCMNLIYFIPTRKGLW